MSLPSLFPDNRTWPHAYETLRHITAITVRFRFPLLVLIPPEWYLLSVAAEAPSQASLWDMKLFAVGIESDVDAVWRLVAVCLFDLAWRRAPGCSAPQALLPILESSWTPWIFALMGPVWTSGLPGTWLSFPVCFCIHWQQRDMMQWKSKSKLATEKFDIFSFYVRNQCHDLPFWTF